jgi:hypothetical protein
MPRTRDYTLMLGTISALLLAIGAVVVVGVSGHFSQKAAVFVATTEGDQKYSAEISSPETVSREQKLKDMKDKIASMSDQIIAAAPDVEPAQTPAVPEAAEGVVPAEQRCSTYHHGGAGWDTSGLIIAEVEGARLVYREVPHPAMASSSEGAPSRDVVLQLPLGSIPSSHQSCIASDVIGVAKGGSLIRNNEVGVYKVFGAETLIGYALDGFPIYGADSSKTDVCGGKMVAGEYRYQLSAKRDTIINCYAGSPVAL